MSTLVDSTVAPEGVPTAQHRESLDLAVRLLARREHSAAEIRRKLSRRSRDAAEIDTVISELVRDGLLSDARFTEAYVRSSIGRGHGPVKIRASLRQRGVFEALIDEVLTHTDEFWLARAQAATSTRFGEEAPNSRQEWGRRARFLSARGFPSDIIYRSLGPQTV